MKKPGKYIVWVRASGPSDDHNSVRFLLNGKATGPDMVSNKQRFEWDRFIWYDAFEIYIPDSKQQTLTMLMRESGHCRRFYHAS